MKSTIYDVARAAGVSIAAVSQVINGKGKISEERRAEIVRVMEQLNYKPSVIAAALTGKKTYTLGLLIPDISNPFFAEIARAVEDQVDFHGYSLVICSTDNKDERVERYLSLLQQKSVDGIIIGTGIDNKEMLDTLIAKSVPVAMIARELPGDAVLTVVVDDYAGGRLAARHLLDLGHTRMAVLSEHTKVSSSRERIRGFQDELTEAGLDLPEYMVKTSGRDLVKDGKRLASELLRYAERPTALFCCTDLLAIGALQAAKEMEVQVPTELSIVGFDNTILASVTDPSLTTIAQPMEQMGKLVVDLILDKQQESPPNGTKRMVLKPELVVRQSTGRPLL
ncbi:LacI family transcriptional regulator [Paenibacillus baekrokdamisoli]|uniref:LacI family transcriptional regulator n=1 Tax=Paenibacillus baekrokdamisoli TaxID=1712516 RepID=A0A3G9IXZ0_9BACL|nr:LacI family DNA-binding transcriptional regulator [Paenibacillus baekrokdamisoli]MBB3068946.1 LacI family transcriptional regulator [Paenibacillus baekrokdamisoli]BBH23767.1 LacI family transcriptional regulator [Paenibacillus baekrokdamisoli]